MNKHEALNVVDILREVSEDRKRARRKLCRFIRENINCCHEDGWLKRKSDKHYLGDLSDGQLESYTKLICKSLEDK